jgi:Na+-driven multidrug efflux pump
MTRRFPPPWRAEKFSGGYIVRDATGFAVAYVYGHSTGQKNPQHVRARVRYGVLLGI